MSESASPEKFLLSKEAGHSYHQQGIDQSSDYAPEGGAEADGVEPCAYAAHCQDGTCEEVGDGVGEHGVLAASAQTSSFDLPFEFEGEDSKPQVEKMNLITYEPVHHGYLVLGERVGNAFSDGKKLK